MKRTLGSVALALVIAGGGFGSFMTPADARTAEPKVAAKQAIVVDVATGDILFAKGATERVPPASLTKLFTANVALETASLDQTMTVSQGALVGEASMGLRAGEQLTFDALLHGMLLASGNDAAMTVAQNIGQLAGDSTRQAVGRFMDLTSARLRELGINDTTLLNPHGLDQEGQLSTARDIAAITLQALATQPAFTEAIGAANYQGAGHTVRQTNELLGRYPGLIGGKTGYTTAAGYCLMEVAERNGARVLVVLLGSTAEAWYQDAATLLDAGFNALATPNTPRYGRITLGSAPAPTAPLAENVTVTAAGGDAIIRPASGTLGEARTPWRWVGAALLLALGGVLTLIHARRADASSRQREVARATRALPGRSHAARHRWDTQPFASARGNRPPARALASGPQPSSGARRLAQQAIMLAAEQDFQGAAGAFYAAAQLDDHLDLTTVPGFWSLCPRGHSAAAAALVKAGRLTDARSIAIVLGRGRRPALVAIGD